MLRRRVVNRDGTRRYRFPIQGKFAVTRPPPEEPTVRKTLTVATNSHSTLPYPADLIEAALVANLFCPGEEKHTMCEPQAQIANSGLIRTRVDLFNFEQTPYSRLNYSGRGS
jgi:hypothetical protein